ncbi:MAG: hypothetical protein J6M35_08545 [Clostridia bacterium]|nr:hypothetical protein [Clostridia bacterium]
MMKKRVIKILAFAAALALIIGVCVFANSLVGNPISKMIVRNTAEKYLEENYGDKDYEIEEVSFNFKDGYYRAFVTSPSSTDSHFVLVISMWGKLCDDFYKDQVLSGGNTAARISREYRSAVEDVFESKSFPYSADISYGDIAFVSRKYSTQEDTPSYAIITEDLTLDAFYDVREIGSRAGELTVYVEDSIVSVERMSEILLDIKSIFDDAGVGFYVISCVLEHPRADDSSEKESRVEVMEFLYSDIYSENMSERVKASDEEARRYHEEQDAEIMKEIENSK